MGKHTSFVLSAHFEKLIAEQVASGRYASASEVVREGLRLVELRQKELDRFNALVDEGFNSGIAEDFSWERVMDEVDAEARDA